MTNVFRDQEKFMRACDQTVGRVNNEINEDQYDLYLNLIKEEAAELQTAVDACDPVEQLDALNDILVVTIGAIHSAGFDAEGAWKEVMRSNFAKIGEDGKVRKRGDGKVLKPTGWTPPNLTPYIKA